MHDVLYKYNNTKGGVARGSTALEVEVWYA